MTAPILEVGQVVKAVSERTGNAVETRILEVGRRFVIVEWPEFKRMQARFDLRPTYDDWHNAYLGRSLKVKGAPRE